MSSLWLLGLWESWSFFPNIQTINSLFNKLTNSQLIKTSQKNRVIYLFISNYCFWYYYKLNYSQLIKTTQKDVYLSFHLHYCFWYYYIFLYGFYILYLSSLLRTNLYLSYRSQKAFPSYKLIPLTDSIV